MVLAKCPSPFPHASMAHSHKLHSLTMEMDSLTTLEFFKASHCAEERRAGPRRTISSFFELVAVSISWHGTMY